MSHVKCILPAAPTRSITGNMGVRMPAWFDIFTFNFPLEVPPVGEEDEDGIVQSIASLDALLATIVASGIDPSRIVLGGISQGAAMTLLTGLTTSKKLAGLIALSSRLPLRYKFKTMVSPHARSIPIFWGHGTSDPLVTYQLGRVCADFLIQEIGVPAGAPEGLDFHTYKDLPHTICDEELLDVVQWLKRIIPS
ncbi:lysophospholipase I [Mycena amicta]|nr:lysophospholipase I [Mycena amicta]